ncbi:MAG: leucyl aminopeptidase family protein [Planctomycetota bacterium]
MFDTIRLAASPSSKTLVIAQFKDAKPDAASFKSLGSAAACVAEAASRTEATGESGVTVEAFPSVSDRQPYNRVIIVGLGEAAKLDTCAFRNVAAAVGRKLAASKLTTAHIDLTAAIKAKAWGAADQRAAGSAFGEGLGLLGWVCDQFRGKGTPDPKRTKLEFSANGKPFATGVERGLALATSANLTRTLSQTPPNIATPMYMAGEAQKMAKATGLSCKVFKGDELVKERLEGLINVGKASINKPCMIRLEYTPKGKSTAKPIVIIGKTITYDTGGLSLKISNGMVGMKRDKDGGCAVLGAMHAIATTIKPNRRVVALLVSAENSVSDEAYRPDDILTYRNGVTVEVTNTDAEGRLVLADALCWACEKEDPAGIIDIATLTGGVVVALGSTYAGLFCEDDKFRAKIEAASAASGERVWRLPMHAEYRDMMKSPVADIVNSNPNRKAHPIQGAAFLSYFVDEKIPWCHLDIAGVHASETNKGMFIEGPTGWGARLFAELLDAD